MQYVYLMTVHEGCDLLSTVILDTWEDVVAIMAERGFTLQTLAPTYDAATFNKPAKAQRHGRMSDAQEAYARRMPVMRRLDIA